MKTYLVGGAVRDELLGLAVSERDYVVVGATEREMLALGFRRLDVAFPVFLHPDTGDEYALARRERKTAPGYKGFEVDAGPDVTLAEDLTRRDLTINALARGDDGRVIDVFQGLDDLDQGILRHITPAFIEDPVRLLRIARFAAKLGRWGFKPAHETFRLMREMAGFAELDTVAPDRLREEMYKTLKTEQPWRFFEMLRRSGALSRLLPELASRMPADSAHGEHERAPALAALEAATQLTPQVSLRCAALLGGLEQAEAIGRRLRLDGASRELIKWISVWPAKRVHAADAEGLLQSIEYLKLLHHAERLDSLRIVWAAIDPASGDAAADKLAAALVVVSRIRAAEMAAEGWQGAELGRMIRQRRLEALSARVF
jgi:tRNA nucleotidyltransferase (CCA-adding enzyme)